MAEPDNPFERFRLGGASHHQLQMLADTMKQAPLLQSRVAKAMRNEGLVSITAHLEDEDSARGRFSPWYREISIRQDLLDARINERGIDAVTDVLSHEMSHVENRKEMNRFHDTIIDRAYKLTNMGSPQDGTGLVGDYIAKGREQEALAELAGINGLADRMRAEEKGAVTEHRLGRRLFENTSCVEQRGDGQFQFKNGIQFDSDSQSVPVTADNIEAVAKCFFDANRGRNTYNAFYAAAAINAFAEADIAHRVENPWAPHGRIHIDLAALGVKLEDLRKQPLDFGSHPPGPFQFTDTSNGQKKIVSLMHNGGREPGAPEVGIAAEAARPAAIPLLSDPAHPGHDLYAQALRGIDASPRIPAGTFTAEQRERVAANLTAGTLGLTASRKHEGLTQEKLGRIDAVTLSTDGASVMAIEGKPGALAHFRFTMPLEQARSGSLEAASQQAFDSLQQQKAQELARQAERDRAPQPEPEGPSR